MSFFTEKVRCAECRDGMVTVTAKMEQIRERILAQNPSADVAFVCKACEHKMMGAMN
jgi:predicted metal-binding protein